MSRLRANQITNKTANGAPTATNGFIVTGVCTATSFSGNGAGLVGVASTDNINTSTNAVLSGIVTVGTLSVTGNAGIAGVLTYEDVTNVDSIGVITARDGLRVTGIATATAFHGDGSQLTGISAGAVGGASTNQVFYENDNSVDVSYTITTDRNAMTAGPIAIKAGVTVTVPSGSFLTIV